MPKLPTSDLFRTTAMTTALLATAALATSPLTARAQAVTAGTAEQAPAVDPSTGTVIFDPIVLRAGQPRVASEVPQAVTVVGEEELDEIGASTIGDVLDVVPGVAGVGSSSFFGQTFNIRGVGAGIAASESSIIQLVDGEQKYYESYRQGSLFVEPDFLRRVEVLRGPGSSTLYGTGALGGVIAMETIEPADLIQEGKRFGGRAKLRYDTNPESYLGSFAGAWRFNDSTEALAAFAVRKLGGSETPDGDRLVRANSLTPNVLLKLNHTRGDHRLRFSYQELYAKGDDQDFNQQEGAQIGLFPGFPGWGVGDITTRDRTAKAVWEYNPEGNRYINLAATLSYTDTLKRIEEGGNPAEPISPTLLGDRSYGLTKLKVTNTADLSGGGIDHFLTVGVEASRQNRTSTVPSASHPEAYTNRRAVYALSEVTWDRLTVNTGLRIERQETTPKGSVTATDDKVSDTATEPQIAAIYKLSDDWSVFGSLARVNRLPTVDELYDSFMGGLPSPDLKPERGFNREIGLSWRGEFRNGAEGAVKLTLFRNDIQNMITRTMLPAPNRAYVNIPDATLKGGELEASYRQNALMLTAGVSYVDGRADDGTTSLTLPNNRVTLGASYEVSPALRLGGFSTFAKGRTGFNDIRRGGYAVHDIYAIWTPQQGAAEGLEVRFGVDNLTNKTYVPATYSTGPATGRNVSLSVSRAF